VKTGDSGKPFHRHLPWGRADWLENTENRRLQPVYIARSSSACRTDRAPRRRGADEKAVSNPFRGRHHLISPTWVRSTAVNRRAAQAS